MKKYTSILCAAAALFIISSCGSNTNKASKSADETTAVKPSGSELYSSMCATCHQANGEGMGVIYPPLAKSDYLADKSKVISGVLKGISGDITVNGKTYSSTMPAQQLRDEEAAAVLTYIYSSWGNSGGAITADEVKAARNK